MADFTDDFVELFTNPGLLAKAVGAGMGNWNPGGLRPGPALSGIGNVLLAARENVQEQQAGKTLADLSSEIGSQGVPMPPGTGEPGGPASLPPGFTALPPGMSRSQVLGRVGTLPNASEMYRFLGKNRGSTALFDTMMGAGEKEYNEARKQRELIARYPGMVEAFKPLHGDRAGIMASEALLSGSGLPKEMYVSSSEAIESGRLRSQQDVIQQKKDMAFDKELEASGFNSYDPNTWDRLTAIAGKPAYQGVNANRAFKGNLQGLQGYINNQFEQYRKMYREQYNMEVIPTGKIDKDGNPSFEVLSAGTAQPSMQQVSDMAKDALERLDKMVAEAPSVFGPYLEVYRASLISAMTTGNPILYRDAMNNGASLMVAVERANTSRMNVRDAIEGRREAKDDKVWERGWNIYKDISAQMQRDPQSEIDYAMVTLYDETKARDKFATPRLGDRAILDSDITTEKRLRAKRYAELKQLRDQLLPAISDMLLTDGSPQSKRILSDAIRAAGGGGPAPQGPPMPPQGAPMPPNPNAPKLGEPGYTGVTDPNVKATGQFRVKSDKKPTTKPKAGRVWVRHPDGTWGQWDLKEGPVPSTLSTE